MKYLLYVIFATIAWSAKGQTPVTDHANNGQLKRMVSSKWNDWKPDPTWKWVPFPPFYVPTNPAGSAYWGVLHRKYYEGPDRRPYRGDGPFIQNYLSLFLQKQDDKKISDSTYKAFQVHLATYASMSGGVADIPWDIYFKRTFNRLFTEVPKAVQALSVIHPAACLKFAKSYKYERYMDYLEMTKDRVKAIHNAFNTKGSRIISYLKIMDEIEKRNNRIIGVMNSYLVLIKTFPTPLKSDKETTLPKNPKTDKQIVNQILSNYHF